MNKMKYTISVLILYRGDYMENHHRGIFYNFRRTTRRIPIPRINETIMFAKSYEINVEDVKHDFSKNKVCVHAKRDIQAYEMETEDFADFIREAQYMGWKLVKTSFLPIMFKDNKKQPKGDTR